MEAGQEEEEGKWQNQRSNRKNRKDDFAVLGFRSILAFMAIVCVVWSLIYNATATRNFRDAMGSSSVRRGYGGETISAISDLQIYPREFQTLHRKRVSQQQRAPKDIDPSRWTPEKRSEMRQEFQRHNRESIYSLFLPDDENATTSKANEEPNMDSALIWSDDMPIFEYLKEHVRKRHKQGLYEFHDIMCRDMETKEERNACANDPVNHELAWGNTVGVLQQPRVIWDYNLCKAFRKAKLFNFSTPHVLITHLNENWGTLSTEVPGRTAQWGSVLRNMFGNNDNFECDPIELQETYLDSPNTLAVFTAQHQSILDHPKVHSIPIGIAKNRFWGLAHIRFLQKQKAYIMDHATSNQTKSNEVLSRPQLLMINTSPSDTRLPQINAIIENFAKSGVNVSNTFVHKAKDLAPYFAEMSRSKFVFSPSGMGWDCYRIWEAISMGAIPVIERHKYRWEVLAYPKDSDKRPKFIRLLDKGEQGGDLEATRKTRAGDKLKKVLSEEHVRKHNATIEIVEYYDGWRRALDDLPVVWIDAEFGDVAPPGEETNGKNYLTPELLEREYDALVAKMETFRYEKLTSVYWLRYIESFLLLNDPSRALEDGLDGPRRFESLSEQQRWESAMENLSPTFNNHTFLPIRIGKGWAGWKDRK